MLSHTLSLRLEQHALSLLPPHNLHAHYTKGTQSLRRASTIVRLLGFRGGASHQMTFPHGTNFTIGHSARDSLGRRSSLLQARTHVPNLTQLSPCEGASCWGSSTHTWLPFVAFGRPSRPTGERTPMGSLAATAIVSFDACSGNEMFHFPVSMCSLMSCFCLGNPFRAYRMVYVLTQVPKSSPKALLLSRTGNGT